MGCFKYGEIMGIGMQVNKIAHAVSISNTSILQQGLAYYMRCGIISSVDLR
jgi:hypothetical protein